MPAKSPIKTKAVPTAKLLYENGADWLYATGEAISDPALWYQAPNGTTHALVNELEYGHLQGHATVDKLHAYAEARKGLKGAPPTLPNLVGWLTTLSKTPPQSIVVPRDFPAGLYQALKHAGLPVVPAETELFFPTRAVKSAAEIAKLKAAQAMNEAAIQHALDILVEADIGKVNALMWQGKPLTSDILRGEINAHAASLGATQFGGGPIVAGGAQAATPHHRGSGVLKAHQLIVIDSFPRHKNGYWGDCTRTVLKGTPSAWQQEVYYAVQEAQALALKLIKPGVDGADIHRAVQSFFEQAGFKTGTDDKGRPFGFFHGTGHGVGLELHDVGPRPISTQSCVLKAGMVTSVEPGLYYPGKGGCRIEDVVVVTTTGHKNFNKLSKARWIFD